VLNVIDAAREMTNIRVSNDSNCVQATLTKGPFTSPTELNRTSSERTQNCELPVGYILR